MSVSVKPEDRHAKRMLVLIPVVMGFALLLMVLLSQSHAPAHSVRAIPVAPSVARPLPAPTAAKAPPPVELVTTKPSRLAPQSERIWKLRVLGVEVFQYVSKVEGPRK
ncbi:hypothetical protein ACSSZE_13130 [Acidithiobacillus caldus]